MNLVVTIDYAPQTALAALLAHTVRAALSLGKDPLPTATSSLYCCPLRRMH